jgi:hypothetical protein
MKKTMKYLGIAVLVISIFLFLVLLTRHADSPGHFDAVMVDNELFFILTGEYNVGGVVIFKSASAYKNKLAVLAAGVDSPRTRQIKYGQTKGFNLEEGPAELQKNVSYFAIMNTSEEVSLGTKGDFIIVDSNKVIMTHHFDPKRPKNRTVTIEKNGRKITVPYSVSFDKDDNKIIVSDPGLSRAP